jgi:ABC-2 type transport system permease protein
MAEDPSWRTTLWRWRLTVATGWWHYREDNPPWIVASTLLPRAILQTVFVVLLCQVVGGPQLRHYAFLGAVVLTMMVSTTANIADVPATDKGSGTFWRVRTGVLTPFAVFVLRSWPYPVVGFITAVVTLAVVAPVAGIALLGPSLVPLLLCLALLALTTSAIGLAGAAFAVGRRADILVGNLLAYLTMLSSNAVIPPGRIRWIDLLGSILPMRHGLEAIRASQAHQPFAAQLGVEIAVGAGWLTVAWLLVRIQVHRAHVHGHDNFS